MATGDIASTGLSSSDLASLIGLVSPAGNGTKTTGEVDTTVTNTTGPKNSSTATVNSGSSTTVGPSTQTTTHGAVDSTHTVADVVSKEGVDRAIQQILEGSQGLAATTKSSHLAGGYNQATQTLLNNDLAVRTAGTVALLNKKVVTTDHTDAYDDVTKNSGYTTIVGGSTSSTISHTDETTDTQHSVTKPITVTTHQNPQVSANVAAGIAAGSLAYNALGSLINAGTGAVVKNVKDLLGAQGIDTSSVDPSILNAPAIGNAAVDKFLQDNLDDIANDTYNLDIDYGQVKDAFNEWSSDDSGDVIGAIGGGGGGGGGSSIPWGSIASAAAAVLDWIVCTELTKQGRFNKRYYIAGAKVFNSYSEIGKIGYYLWAIPCVHHLRKHPDSFFSKVLENVFNWRAEYIAHNLGVRGAKFNKKGMVVSAVLYPTCWILGHACYLLNVKRDYHAVYPK